MAGNILETAATGVPVNLKNPAAVITKLPSALVTKLMFGLKVGAGGTAILIGVVIVILIIGALLSVVGIDLSSLIGRGRKQIGV